MKVKSIKDAAKKKAPKSAKVIDINALVKKKETHIEQLKKLQEVRTIARKMGIDTRNVTMKELVRSIQRAEGYNACFMTEYVRTCGQLNCLWYQECVLC